MTQRNTPARSTPKHLPPGLIEQYLFGKLPDRTRNRVERHLLECDLCSDAMEGLSGQPGPAKMVLDIEELRIRLDKRVKERKLALPFGMQPFAVAASLVLLTTCALVVWLTLHYQRGSAAGNRVEPITKRESKPVPVSPAQPDAPQVIAAAPAEEESPQRSAAVRKADPVNVEPPGPTTPPSTLLAQKARQLSPEEKPIATVKPSSVLQAPKEAERLEMDKISDQLLTEAPPVTRANADEKRIAGNATSKQSAPPASRTSSVQGKVTDAQDGMALPGVRVMIKGTDQSTLTDTYGNFSLQTPDTATLVFQFIGMLSEEKSVAGETSMQVALQADIKALNEVVVVGYGMSLDRKVPFQNAKPTGGLHQFNRYVKENLRLPDSVQTEKREAVVKVECVVMPDGSLTSFTIKKGAGDAFNQEAIRVIQEGPRWEPAKEGGKAVPSRVTVKVPFKE